MPRRNEGGDSPAEFLFKMLRNPLDDSSDMTVNGAVTAVMFEYTVPLGSTVELNRINIDIVDGGIGYGEFAGLGSDLSKGIKLEIIDPDGATVLLDFTDSNPIKSNAQWTHLAGTDTVAIVAAGDDLLPIRWTIVKTGSGEPMVLNGGEIFRLTVQDDLTTISHFEGMLQGKVHP